MLADVFRILQNSRGVLELFAGIDLTHTHTPSQSGIVDDSKVKRTKHAADVPA